MGVSPNSLGEHLAVSTSLHNPDHLILASRTPSKIKAVIDKICIHAPDLKISTVVVDLASQSSIRTAAKEIVSLATKIDVVINNAAINVQGHELTKEGIETHFGVNHIGLFLFTNLLKPLFTASTSKPARVVNLSSAGHRL